MIAEFKKGIDALKHPGIDTSFARLLGNAIPFYMPFLKPKPPVTIYISVNSRCNLKCKMCDVGLGNEEGTFYKNLSIDSKSHELDINVIKQIVDEVSEDKPLISFNSTEPLLYKHLSEAILYCSEKGLKTQISTGGYLLPNMAEELARAGLSRLSVSIDGVPSVHNAIRGRKDSFERDIEGIRKFFSASKKLNRETEIIVSSVISAMNYDSLESFVRVLENEPISQIKFVHMWYITNQMAYDQNTLYGELYPVSESCLSEDVNPCKIDINTLFTEIEKIKSHPKVQFLPWLDGVGLEKFYHQPNCYMQDNAKCLASWFIIQILADGRVIPLTRCHNESFGNVNEESFYEIWYGKRMEEWRKFIKNVGKMPVCKRCDLIY